MKISKWIILAGCLVSLMFTGCAVKNADYDDLVTEYNDLLDEYNLITENASAYDKLKGAQLSEEESEDLTSLIADFQRSLDQEVQGGEISISTYPNRVCLKIEDYVLFNKASATFAKSNKYVLSKIADIIKQYTNTTTVIEGHSDSKKRNWAFSYSRVTAVVSYLEDQGIEEKNIHSITYSDLKPVVQNTSSANRKKNRRVEIVVFPTS